MIDHPAATPLDNASLAFSEVQKDSKFAKEGISDSTRLDNQFSSRKAVAASVSAYINQILGEPFFISAVAEAIMAQKTPLAAARSALDAIRPEALGALFPDPLAEVEEPDMTGIEIEWIGGLCPVQAEGTADGVPLYFRARGSHWELWIGDQRHHFTQHPNAWSYREPFRTWPEAGVMSESLARRYISQGVAHWRREKAA